MGEKEGSRGKGELRTDKRNKVVDRRGKTKKKGDKVHVGENNKMEKQLRIKRTEERENYK